MFAFWLFFFGGLIAAGGFLTPQGAASFGWFAYAPPSHTGSSPGPGPARGSPRPSGCTTS